MFFARASVKRSAFLTINRRYFSDKYTLQDIKRECLACLRTQNALPASAVYEHLKNSLGVKSFADWKDVSKDPNIFNLEKTLVSWGIQTITSDGKIRKFKLSPNNNDVNISQIYEFLSQKENAGTWVDVKVVDKSFNVNLWKLTKTKGFMENIKKHGIDVQKSARGDILKLGIKPEDEKKPILNVQDAAEKLSKILDTVNWKSITDVEKESNLNFSSCQNILAVKRRLLQFNILLYLSNGKPLKLKMVETKELKKERNLKEIKEKLFVFLKKQNMWTKLSKVDALLKGENLPSLKSLCTPKELEKILKDWGLLLNLENQLVKEIRIGTSWDETLYIKPTPLNAEAEEEEASLAKIFSGLQLREPQFFLLSLIYKQKDYNGELYLSAEIERQIVNEYIWMSGYLLSVVSQMVLVETEERNGKHFLRNKEEGVFRNFSVSKPLTGVIFGPRGSSIQWIKDFCGNSIYHRHSPDDRFSVFHITGSLEQRAEATVFICEAPLKHIKLNRLDPESVLSWFCLCVDSFQLFIENQMWDRAEKLRKIVQQFFEREDIDFSSVQNSKAMERLLTLYQSPSMNKEWLVTDWKHLCKWYPQENFLVFLLEIFKEINPKQLKNVKIFLNDITFWKQMELSDNLENVENVLNSLHSVGVLTKESLHCILETHGKEKSNMDLGFLILNWMNKNGMDVDLETLTLFIKIVERKNDPFIAKWVFEKMILSLPDFACSSNLLESVLKTYARNKKFDWINELLEAHQTQFRDNLSLVFLLFVQIKKHAPSTESESQVKQLFIEGLARPSNLPAAKLLLEHARKNNISTQMQILHEIANSNELPDLLSEFWLALDK